MRILILGSDGMLGHVVTTYLREHGHIIEVTSRDKNKGAIYYDAYKDVYAIERIIKENRPEAVVNCIGILNQAAEKNHSAAVMLNSFLPNYLDLLSDQYGFQFVHITTDCVFDGKKGDYSEDAIPNSESFYGLSKTLGEINNKRTLTLRLSIVGPDNNQNGIGLFKWFSEQNGEVKGFSRVIWSGVTTIELARVIEEGLQNNVVGLNHVVNNEKISKSDLLKLFEKYFKFGIKIIDDDSYESDKSLIRTNKSYDFHIPSYEVMVKDMYDWVMKHDYLYTELIEKMNI